MTDDQLLIAVIQDKIKECADNSVITCTDFLDLKKQSDAAAFVSRQPGVRWMLYGGIGCYVRAYLVGLGAVCYVQPFTVNVEGETLEKEEIAPVHNYSYYLRMLITFLDNYVFSKDSIVRKCWNWLASDWGVTIPNW